MGGGLELGVLAFGLGALRLFGVLVVHPLFRRAVGWSWTLVAAALAVVLAGAWVASGAAAWDPDTLRAWLESGALPIAALLEFGMGALFGLLIGLPGWAVLGAGAMGRPGLVGAGVEGDPSVDDGLTTLVAAAAVVGAMGLGLHHVWLVALVEVFDGLALADPGRWLEATAGVSWAALAVRAHAVLVLALALAAPWWLTRAVVSLGAGLVSGSAPIFEAARRGSEPALIASLGLLALFAALSAFPAAWGRGLGGL